MKDTQQKKLLLRTIYISIALIGLCLMILFQIRKSVTNQHLTPQQMPTLTASWTYYKNEFIKGEGHVVDPDRDFNTISEAQAYAMLRAVYAKDRETFDSVWAWTQENLQVRDDYLFAWIWGNKNGRKQVIDQGTATDAEVDIALALIFAAQQWQHPRYQEDAHKIIDDIWEKEVKNINQTYYLLAMDKPEREEGFLINPSYFSPAHYRIFATVDSDPTHHWDLLADHTYKILDQISKLPENRIVLPPNWMVIDRQGAHFSSAKGHINDPYVDHHGYDAFRIVWRVALDYIWFETPEALAYLKSVSPWYEQQWQQNQSIKSVYSMTGYPQVEYQSISTSAGPIIALKFTNPDISEQIYRTRLQESYNPQGYWDNPKAYYDQNWAWFIEAFYNDQFPNLAQ